MTRTLILAAAALAIMAAVPVTAQARSSRSSVDDNSAINCVTAAGVTCDDRGRGLDDGPNHDIGDDHGRRHGGHGADDAADHDDGHVRHSGDDDGDRHGGDDDRGDDHGGDRHGGGDDNSGRH